MTDAPASLATLLEQAWHLNEGDVPDQKEDPAFWTARAADFAGKAHAPEARAEVEDLLTTLSWDPTETVLDVGAGPGTFSIPVSAQVAHVTAVDISEAMLQALQEQAARECRANIAVRAGRWLALEGLQPHDTVLCFNAFGVIALDEERKSQASQALAKLRDLARHRLLLLIPHADIPADHEMRRILRWDGAGRERQRIGLLYLLFADLGMLPDVRILYRPFRWTFTDPEEATTVLAKKLGLPDDPALRDRLHGHLRHRLTRREGSFHLAYPCPQALFHWVRPPASSR